MQLRHVVTCFLLDTASGRVLLGRRSDAVSTYPGRWAAISGSVEDHTPLEQADREIREETGLGPGDVRLVAEGAPIRFPAWNLGTVWVVHPFLFHCLRPEGATPDWEHVRFEWVRPGDIDSLETVPKLAEAFRAVCGHEGTPRAEVLFQEVRHDRERGADELGMLTLQALQAACGAAQDADGRQWLDRMRDTCRVAAGLRPSMASVRSAALEAFGACTQALERTPGMPAERAADAIAEIITERERDSVDAAAGTADILAPGTRIVTLSLSSTVLAALHDAAERVAEVIVAESRPRCEGRETARLAASFGITTRLVTDAAAAGALATADVLLFGADAVRSDGSVVNKTGTLALCLAARYFGCRALCAATPAKVLPEGAAPGLECMEPAELGDPVEGVEVRNPYFELIPAELIGPVVLGTEATGGEQLAERARRLAALQLALDGREGDVSQ